MSLIDSNTCKSLRENRPLSRLHINNLPPELLRLVFRHYCGRFDSPLLLLLVCSLWNAIVTDYTALWNSLHYYDPDSMRFMTPTPFWEQKEVRFVYNKWKDIIRATKRAGKSPLSLKLWVGTSEDIFLDDSVEGTQENSTLGLFNRCKWLHLRLPQNGFIIKALNNLPALEELDIEAISNEEADTLFDAIEKGSPLLRSLSLGQVFPKRFPRPTLLRRILHLTVSRLMPKEESLAFFAETNRLETLVINANVNFMLPSRSLSRLVSLEISYGVISCPETKVELPALDHLCLVSNWDNIRVISAPKLTQLVLIEYDGPVDMYMSALRDSTIRPTSLVITDRLSQSNFLELLCDSWSGLQHLHLKSRDIHPSNIYARIGAACAALLAGNNDATQTPCSQLRYFTVDIKLFTDNSEFDPPVQGLRAVIEERRRRGVGSLQNIKCVWYLHVLRFLDHVAKNTEDSGWIDIFPT